MLLPTIREDVARNCLGRLSAPAPLGDSADRLHRENPEYMRAVSLVAMRVDVKVEDALFIAFFCYFLLQAQAEVEDLEALVGGDRCPAALR